MRPFLQYAVDIDLAKEVIAKLKAKNSAIKVVCYFSAGSWEDYRWVGGWECGWVLLACGRCIGQALSQYRYRAGSPDSCTLCANLPGWPRCDARHAGWTTTRRSAASSPPTGKALWAETWTDGRARSGSMSHTRLCEQSCRSGSSTVPTSSAMVWTRVSDAASARVLCWDRFRLPFCAGVVFAGGRGSVPAAAQPAVLVLCADGSASSAWLVLPPSCLLGPKSYRSRPTRRQRQRAPEPHGLQADKGRPGQVQQVPGQRGAQAGAGHRAEERAGELAARSGGEGSAAGHGSALPASEAHNGRPVLGCGAMSHPASVPWVCTKLASFDPALSIQISRFPLVLIAGHDPPAGLPV